MEIRVDVHGTSCHGSAPDRGDNAIYKMADIIADVRALNNNGCDESTDIKGLVKMLDPRGQPLSTTRMPLPGPRHLHRQPDLLHQPQPLRRGRFLRHLHRPSHDRRASPGVLPGRDP